MPSSAGGGGASPSTSPCCWLFCWSGNHIRTRACTSVGPFSTTPPTAGAAPATAAPTPLSFASLTLPPKWLLTSALPLYGFTANTCTVLLLVANEPPVPHTRDGLDDRARGSTP
jgi:hypothetical protein